MRVFVERSGTPKTTTSIRSPTPSFTFEFGTVLRAWREDSWFAVADGGSILPGTGVWAARWRPNTSTKNMHALRKTKPQFRPDIPRLLDETSASIKTSASSLAQAD